MTKETTQRLALKLMREYTPIPEQKINGLEVKNEVLPAGKQVTVTSFREAIFAGTPPLDLKLSKPYTKQSLTSEEDGVWMTNLPSELVQQYREFVVGARGNVMIGGLGLGVVANMCLKRKSVSGVTVVELDPNVIKLNESRGLKVVQADIFQFLKSVPNETYDQLYLDIWQSTGEWTWQSQVVPLRRLIGNKKFKRIVGWQENVMIGQVWNGLARAADMDAELIKRKSNCHWYAFRKAVVERGLRPEKPRITEETPIPETFEISEANKTDYKLQNLARMFLTWVGSPWWEQEFGKFWDEAWEAEKNI